LSSNIPDRVLVKNAQADDVNSLHLLYNKYEKLGHKKWHSLAKKMNYSSRVMDVKDDYYSETYLTFIKALKAIKLDRIKNDKWLFMNYYMRYLDSQNSRFINNIMKQSKHEVNESQLPEDTDWDWLNVERYISAEDEVIRQETSSWVQDIIDKVYANEWSPLQQRLWDLRSADVSIAVICEKLQLSRWKVTKHLKAMRQKLNLRLQEIDS
jgi:RNA polymerase sigma factor (sigma-70 family)